MIALIPIGTCNECRAGMDCVIWEKFSQAGLDKLSNAGDT